MVVRAGGEHVAAERQQGEDEGESYDLWLGFDPGRPKPVYQASAAESCPTFHFSGLPWCGAGDWRSSIDVWLYGPERSHDFASSGTTFNKNVFGFYKILF